ncbi:hypothetical protein L6E12_04970 [Actinokineospora sp. PR83]|uniref:hypothetical protein n=1 Tax=Actinokineospora sp. PR83 TaxID=2884908 RepID=UPI0027DF0A4E|nr:hypothetical protein [Actinokineospora sp. PR83]MCG8915142.1 hypothetical protein [Actinokineospora sp. PR83]
MSAFVDSLLAGRPLIMEVKRKSPHGEDLMAGRAVAEVVASYAAAGASCVSVVTGRWFGGTPELLAEVAAATALPVLQKDFLTRRDHLHRARDLGASAVLLTAGLLTRSSLTTLVEGALALGLTPFVEVTTEAEVAALPLAEHCAIAVNNKDIKTGEKDAGDLGRSERMLPHVLAAGTRCPVSASGIADPAVAAHLVRTGYRGLLLGTSLLRAGNVADWVSEFDTALAVPAV